MANATQAFSRKPPPLSWLDLGCPLRWDPAGPIRSTRLLLSLHWGWRRPRRAVRPRSARAKVPWAGITALLLGKGKLPKVLEVGGDEGHHNPAFPQGWRKACESDESGDGTRGPSDAEKGILAKKKIRAPGSLEAPGDGVWGGRWYVLSSLRFCKLQLSRMGTVPGWLSFPPTLEPWDDREGPGTWERSRAPLLSSGTSGMAPILDPKGLFPCLGSPQPPPPTPPFDTDPGGPAVQSWPLPGCPSPRSRRGAGHLPGCGWRLRPAMYFPGGSGPGKRPAVAAPTRWLSMAKPDNSGGGGPCTDRWGPKSRPSILRGSAAASPPTRPRGPRSVGLKSSAST